jgi:hypothetical protein
MLWLVLQCNNLNLLKGSDFSVSLSGTIYWRMCHDKEEGYKTLSLSDQPD